MSYNAIALLFVATWVLTLLYPWHPSWPKARIAIHLPWLLLLLWGWYEYLLPNYMNIRLDIPVIAIALTVAFTVYLIRLVLFQFLKSKAAE